MAEAAASLTTSSRRLIIPISTLTQKSLNAPTHKYIEHVSAFFLDALASLDLKEEREQTTWLNPVTIFHPIFSVFVTKRLKLMAYRSSGSLIGAKFTSTEGALRLPTAYDNHPFNQSHPIRPTHI